MKITLPSRREVAALASIAVFGTGFASISTATAAPVEAAALRLAPIQIAAGSNTGLVIGADGVPYGTGDNSNGQLTGSDSTEKRTLTRLTGLPSGVKALSISASNTHLLVAGSDGIAYGAGSNAKGQLTGTASPNRTTLTPLLGLPAGIKARAVSARGGHSLVLGSNGIAYGTGNNTSGQLTGDDGLNKTSLTPLKGLPAGIKATAIAAGNNHSLVLGSNKSVYGTGYNGTSQLTGVGDKDTLMLLAGLPAGVKATAIAASGKHSLVLGSNGIAYGTGNNGDGALTGNDPVKFTLKPLIGLPTGSKATAVTASGNHSLVLGSNGIAYGTGNNGSGQLTGNDGLNKTSLTPLAGLPSGVKAAAVSADNHSLVLGSNGIVYGTGANLYGQLTGTSTDKKTTLTPFTGQIISASTAPIVTGKTYVGGTASVDLGAWAPQPTSFAYQWRLNGQAIAGATGSGYKVRRSDWKKSLSVVVTGKRAGSASGTSTSSAVKVLRPPLKYGAKTKQSITGTAKVGQTLKLKNLNKKGWKPKATKQSIQWLRNGQPIKGATKTEYKLKKADQGKKISARITATKKHYVNGTYTTKPTKRIKKK